MYVYWIQDPVVLLQLTVAVAGEHNNITHIIFRWRRRSAGEPKSVKVFLIVSSAAVTLVRLWHLWLPLPAAQDTHAVRMTNELRAWGCHKLFTAHLSANQPVMTATAPATEGVKRRRTEIRRKEKPDDCEWTIEKVLVVLQYLKAQKCKVGFTETTRAERISLQTLRLWRLSPAVCQAVD